LVNRNGIPKSSAHLLVNHQAQYEQIVKPGHWDGEYKSPDSGNKIFYDLLFIQRLLTKLFTPGSSKRAELSSRISQFKKVLLGFSINIHITGAKRKVGINLVRFPKLQNGDYVNSVDKYVNKFIKNRSVPHSPYSRWS
jgi:hypothetical protein